MDQGIFAAIISAAGAIIAAVISVILVRRRRESDHAGLSDLIAPPSKFWDVLQNSVVIVFGLSKLSGEDRWSYVSERDRTAAKEMENFLKGRGLAAVAFSIQESKW